MHPRTPQILDARRKQIAEQGLSRLDVLVSRQAHEALKAHADGRPLRLALERLILSAAGRVCK